MNRQPNIIQLAVVAAGGPTEVAAKLGLGHATPSQWTRRKAIPLAYVDDICEMGQHTITKAQILDYMTEVDKQRKAARLAKLAQKQAAAPADASRSL